MPRDYDVALAIASIFDAGASDTRLEQLARLTAARYWRQPEEEDWSRQATFLFRTASEWIYAVFPIFRRRYYAAVRVRKEDTAGTGAVRSDMFEVLGVTVMQEDAMQLAFHDVQEDF